MIPEIQSAQTLPKEDGHNMNVVMKTVCPPGYHHNGFVASRTLGT